MDLKTFVSETITQVLQGVADSSKAASEIGGSVNPNRPSKEPGGMSYLGMEVTEIEFDVAICATQSDSDKIGGGVMVACFGVGGSSIAASESSVTSRVKFHVPVSFPRQIPRNRASTAGAE